MATSVEFCCPQSVAGSGGSDILLAQCGYSKEMPH